MGVVTWRWRWQCPRCGLQFSSSGLITGWLGCVCGTVMTVTEAALIDCGDFKLRIVAEHGVT